MNQIEVAGVPLNQWVSLASFCEIVNLQDDNNIFPDNLCMQFYFEKSSELMFVRHLENAKITEDTSEKENTAIVYKNNKPYRASIQPYSAEDAIIGKYHDVICCSNVSGFLINKY